MNTLFAVDWKSIFFLDTPILEIFLRGSITYLSLFILLRFILKRQAGAVGITDLLVIVLIADASQNAMASSYRSITDGILLVMTIVFWSYVLNWLGYQFPQLQSFIYPPPLPLIKHGRLLRQNMRKELITEGELMTQLREQGIDDIRKVKAAHIEGDGYISVVTYNSSADMTKRDRRVT
ncbi:MAG TPA: YetF domain-containing protein [Allocoleopsis sp.]